MPGRVGTLFHRLWQDVSWLVATWEVFKELFSRGPKQAELLTWAAPDLFRLLDRLLVQDLFLALSRLTDPARDRGRDNVSLSALAMEADEVDDRKLATEIKTTVKEIRASCQPLLERRNRVLAHSDLATALDPEKELMPGITFDETDNLVQKVVALLQSIELHYCDSSTIYDAKLVSVDAENLVALLQLARQGEEESRCQGDSR